MNINRKTTPRAFRIDLSKTQSGLQHQEGHHHRTYRGAVDEPVSENKNYFRSTTKNDAVEKEYSEVLRKIRLVSQVVILGFDKAIKHSSQRNRAFLDEMKNKNIEELLDALNERRGLLSKQIYISR